MELDGNDGVVGFVLLNRQVAVAALNSFFKSYPLPAKATIFFVQANEKAYNSQFI